jgi:hypothetical protein
MGDPARDERGTKTDGNNRAAGLMPFYKKIHGIIHVHSLST